MHISFFMYYLSSNFHWLHISVQGDTVKSIEMELEDVISTGLFRLKADAPFVLEFQRSAGLAMSDTNPSQHLCIWHTNDISEFVTHLGFLSSKGEKSRTFVCLNEVYLNPMKQGHNN